MPIHVLPDEVASQIAAGEVVERPASVVKELLENSLDAGASYIAIQVEKAGQRLIEVKDDGCGIPKEELHLCIARYATSKLQTAQDLLHIETLGFRGEALSSIGSVSRMTITSRTPEQDSGAMLLVDGGKVNPIQLIGTPIGTVVRVEDLFYNLPARRKFLKKPVTERRHIDDVVTHYALAYPHVRIHLLQEGDYSLQTSGNGDQREVLAALYGVDIARQMLEVWEESEKLKISGFVSPTSVTRSNRQGISFFVNGRWIKDITLATALIQAYHTLLMVGRYPLAVLFLELPHELVDINVHPTKAEVRFQDRDRLFKDVRRTVRRALLAHSPLPGMEGSTGLRWVSPPILDGYPSGLGWQPPEGITDGIPPAGTPSDSQPSFVKSEAQASLLTSGVPLLRLLGQIGATYLVAEGPDGLYLIDQHSAHERILYERFMNRRGEKVPSQQMLQPVSVELSPGEARLLEDYLPVLEKLGFGVEPFGHHAFIVRSIPALLEGMNPTAALRVVIEDFEEDETPLKDEVEARIVARVCKSAAVKAGQVLSPEEQRGLLRDLEACEAPRTCPHGRPTMIHLPVDLLSKQFKRRG
ncbi:MAG: DNA mismatch repair endonuclease MutL [Chloroflexota bacterium]